MRQHPVEGFREGIGVLLVLRQQIEVYLRTLEAIDRRGPDLEGWFGADRHVFSDQFQRLYGGGP